MSDSALIIFVKNPELGKVKTRLAKTIGDELALAVYNKLIAYTQRETAQTNADVVVYYSSSVDEQDDWEGVDKKVQSSGDLGEKMATAFAAELASYQKVCIIGTDCAQLTKSIVEQAFTALDTHDYVFGPANDGGYYLMGMKTHTPELFENMEWSTERVLSASLSRIAPKSYHLLPELIDVDTIGDWEKVMENFE
ncbi:TIGR04282 family arsenosugar biosynthesis glycosyltransferase [Reichenbachiella carrageenanivorans]|uniref:TIGR04282 family arsenosugar biosynthesis glycosyltransferase n=1 Tax=Reichenbachiella carrageenanivorans TaxID=2979869 RepID=A0ABY6CXZ9_9BACT|nr:TIGR04282 family arsenosugar biosynthesis glycosyltransferase [Reichenbachiella carrageenanivorans]UXX78796.1 TIGR04282 family arsenosugar biosynthesis glycosyltransferase [Reichenbachiella carrageenanivorans]